MEIEEIEQQVVEDFKTADGKRLSAGELIDEIKKFMLADDRFSYRILIGTDSENQEAAIDFVTAIVVHRIGIGARYFWRRKVVPKHYDFHQRLWQEALMSLEISKSLLKLLTEAKLSFGFELHLDLGNNGRSQSVIKELINLVRGHGFEVKVKPEAYAASTIADKLI
jgi:hypothetical protein